VERGDGIHIVARDHFERDLGVAFRPGASPFAKRDPRYEGDAEAGLQWGVGHDAQATL
jgi:hypothetical protein